MIKIEDRTSNKKLRIYRPDILLEDICNSNGFAIVLKMIPCFGFLKKLNDIEQKDPIKFNKEFDKKNHFPADVDPCAKFTFSYGVNVRTPRVKKILPFATAYIYDEYNDGKGGKVKEGRIIRNFQPSGIDLTVPKFTDEFHIRELFLYADITDGIIKKEDIVILSLTTDDKKFDKNTLKELKEKLEDKKSFLTVQAKTLKIEKRVYLWLTSEDYNVNTAGDALSNIIAISNDFDVIESYIKPRRLDFINLLFLIKARYMFDTEIAQRKTAIASAKAAIMSRNMSHNLGSHVMAYLKQHLNSVQDMVRDNVLDSIIKSDDDLSTTEGFQKWLNNFQKNQNSLSKVALPFLVGLGKFISYLQERQDFIATIATNYVPYLSTVNFKDFVYDELNPDLRYERHPERSGLEPDNILLGNIARSEGLARGTRPTKNKKTQMSDIVLKYKSFEGKSFLDPLGNLKSIPNIEEQQNDLDEMRDFMIALPGGVVGRQAIFSIVENVIRNAAKHGKWGEAASQKRLELTFNRYYLSDYIDGRIKKDFVPKGEDSFPAFFDKYYAQASDINDLCIVTLTDNMVFEENKPSKCEHLAAIRKALKEPYIDNDSVEMLQTNKGIKEMRISAAWMRGIEDDVKINPLYITPDFDNKPKAVGEKDDEDHWIQVAPEPQEEEKNFVYKYWDKDKKHWIGQAPVLMVRACAEKENEDFHLQYIFCLPKPKEVAIILSEKEYTEWVGYDKDNEKTIKDLYSRNAWGVFSVESFIQERNKSYEFIIASSEVTESDTNRIKQLAPKRVYTQKEIDNILYIDKTIFSIDYNSFASVFESLYEMLCQFDPEIDTIFIGDDRVKNGQNLPDNVKIIPNASTGRWLYKTHNETEENFTAYIKAADEQTKFVEGITGNNSTDRLVRNDNINKLWLYKHLHAMKTSVGIFDERIFSKIYKKDEADIRISELPINDLIEHVLAITPEEDDSYRDIEDLKEEELSLEAKEERLKDILGRDPRELLGDYIAIAYEKKSVSIFNILKTDTKMEIYGYGGIKWNEEKTRCYSIIEKIGEITWVADKSMIGGHFDILNFKDLKFDYLSIHQGLLDKIYELFDIKHENAEAKHEFTLAFYREFSKNDAYITYKDKKISSDFDKEGKEVYFLPNLCIHSGRSKPSFDDMPQHQPFIQYAAIEHAVMDCKYSLVELLDFARYE